MATDDKDSIRRGFVLEPTNGRYRATPLSTVGELQCQLLSTPRTIVLPGQLDEATIQVLSSFGVSREFLRAHLEDTAYSRRGSRQQDAIKTYFWKMPQFYHRCGECTTQNPLFTNIPRGPADMLRASLWVAKGGDISILLVQQSNTRFQCATLRTNPFLEDEVREKLLNVDIAISIQDYVNQLVYERWLEYIAELNMTEATYAGLTWKAMALIEQNLDTARYIAWNRNPLYLADEHAWQGLLRRLDRRMRHVQAYHYA